MKYMAGKEFILFFVTPSAGDGGRYNINIFRKMHAKIIETRSFLAFGFLFL